MPTAEIHSLEHRLSQAEMLAQRGWDKIEGHEKVCAERYQNIQTSQTNQSTMLLAINNSVNKLTNGAHESMGKWKAITIMSVAIGILYTVLKLSGNAP